MSRQGPSSMLPRPGMTSFTWQAGAAPRTPSPPVSRSPASRFRRPICPRPATLRRPARSLSWVAWCFWPQASSWAVAADSRSRHLGAGAASHCRGEGASQLMPPPPPWAVRYTAVTCNSAREANTAFLAHAPSQKDVAPIKYWHAVKSPDRP